MGVIPVQPMLKVKQRLHPRVGDLAHRPGAWMARHEQLRAEPAAAKPLHTSKMGGARGRICYRPCNRLAQARRRARLSPGAAPSVALDQGIVVNAERSAIQDDGGPVLNRV